MESKDKLIGIVLIITGIAFIALGVWMGMPGLFKNNVNIYGDGISNNETGILVEDVIISGYACAFSQCNVSIKDSENYENYALEVNDAELFKTLDDYTDYLRVDIYYVEKDNGRTIVDYKLFLKATSEEITDVKTEEELRTKIGLYSAGVYTEEFTLSKIGMTGGGVKDDTSYTYTEYTFVDSKDNEYEMKYIHSDKEIDLVEGNKYTVNFEVEKGTFGYEFYIKSVN